MNSFSIADSIPQNLLPDSLLPQNSHQPELPQQIAQDLRALGGVRAPNELWQRVQDQRSLEALGGTLAPAELWSQVQAELRPSAVVVEKRVLRGYFGRKSIAAAAALLVFSGLSLFGPWSSQPPATANLVVLAQPIGEAQRASFRARVSFKRVSAEQMSSFSKGLAGSMGGLMVEDDA
ncbi:MAG: hypothetical protein QM477_10420 [Planctomycetota bacterium]